MTTQDWNGNGRHEVMNENNKKVLAFFLQVRYILINIPVTPLSLWANAHFGRVFSLEGYNQ